MVDATQSPTHKPVVVKVEELTPPADIKTQKDEDKQMRTALKIGALAASLIVISHFVSKVSTAISTSLAYNNGYRLGLEAAALRNVEQNAFHKAQIEASQAQIVALKQEFAKKLTDVKEDPFNATWVLFKTALSIPFRILGARAFDTNQTKAEVNTAKKDTTALDAQDASYTALPYIHIEEAPKSGPQTKTAATPKTQEQPYRALPYIDIDEKPQVEPHIDIDEMPQVELMETTVITPDTQEQPYRAMPYVRVKEEPTEGTHRGFWAWIFGPTEKAVAPKAVTEAQTLAEKIDLSSHDQPFTDFINPECDIQPFREDFSARGLSGEFSHPELEVEPLSLSQQTENSISNKIYSFLSQDTGLAIFNRPIKMGAALATVAVTTSVITYLAMKYLTPSAKENQPEEKKPTQITLLTV